MPVGWRDEHYLRRKRAMAKNVYSRRLYLNADKTKVLEEGDEGAAYLLGGAGSPVAEEDVEKYGLTTKHFREADEAPAEEPHIVISGGANSGPGIVKGETLSSEGGASAAEEAETKKASKKSSK
jgi:hypothetical protein